MSKLVRPTELSRDGRVVARLVLALLAIMLCLGLLLSASPLGVAGAVVAQPSPSASASEPAGESGAIFLVNPNPSYDPGFRLSEPPREPGTPDPPKVTDKFDGVDEAYHIVAVVKDPPPDAVVEAYYQAENENEVTIGQMTPTDGSPDTYEILWEIDERSIDPGPGLVRVRLFDATAGGFDEVSADEVAVRMQHDLAPDAPEEAESINIAWPAAGGPLGFYKGGGKAALWRANVNGSLSAGFLAPEGQGDRETYQVRLFYSVSPIGAEPAFIACGTVGVGGVRADRSRAFSGTCTLTGKDLPSRVTAVAAVAVQDQEPDEAGSDNVTGNVREPTAEGADAHRVLPYVPSVSDLKVDLFAQAVGGTGDQPSQRHQLAPGQGSVNRRCLSYIVRVTDHLDRPVLGANVDIHASGPGDQVRLGDEGSSCCVSSGYKTADKGGHSTESGADCDPFIINTMSTPPGANFGDQSEHPVPGGNDVKHRESTVGSGASAGGGLGFIPGAWRFHIFSDIPGETQLIAWVDDEPLASEAEVRPDDDDVYTTGAPQDSNFAQWTPVLPTVSIDPVGQAAAVGTCARFVVRARANAMPIKGANIDVHATGPGDLDFCDPEDASPRSAPTAGTDHNPEDAGEATHSGGTPAQHTEGQSNDAGNFVFGLRSSTPGDTTITAWYDAGETGNDDDTQGASGSSASTGEPAGSATLSWIEGEAKISFVNPSPYGPGSPGAAGDGTRVSRVRDVDTAYHVVARVASIAPIAGVEFFVRTGSNPLVKIGDGISVGGTGTYETYWPVDVPDGSHTLVARIAGTPIQVEQAITVDSVAASGTPPDPSDFPYETVEITSPLNGATAGFTRGKLPIRGVASAGTEGVDFFYTKASPLATPGSGSWIYCGFVGLPTGSAPQEFNDECALVGSDQPNQVTGIAAITYNCREPGCDAEPIVVSTQAGTVTTRNPGEKESGDAHRVFGVEAVPILSVEPPETAADAGTCQTFVITLQDQSGQPIRDANLDAHLSGPGNGGNYCQPQDGSGTGRRAPDQGGHVADGDEVDEAYHDDDNGRVHHTEAETNANGRFVVGIESASTGDSTLTVWLDRDDDDVHDGDETSDTSLMHWEGDTSGGCDIEGTDDGETLEGTSASERICGFGGNDTIRGRGGNDTIVGGPGRDVLRGNSGSDLVYGGRGFDKVFGGGAGDQLRGGGGNDTVKGHRGSDRLFGHSGKDLLDGGPDRDTCNGGKGRDRFRRCERGGGRRSFALRTRPI